MEKGTIDAVNAVPLLKTLGIALREIGEHHAVMELAVEERHANYLGGAHGGVIATLIDTAAFFPRIILPSGRRGATTNLNVSYLRHAPVGSLLTARSEILHSGRRTASVSVRVTDEEMRLVAHGTATVMFFEE